MCCGGKGPVGQSGQKALSGIGQTAVFVVLRRLQYETIVSEKTKSNHGKEGQVETRTGSAGWVSFPGGGENPKSSLY